MALQKKVMFYFVIVNAILMVAGDSFKDDSFDREVRSGRAGVVFKPLLGKRTYTENREIQLLRMLEAADALKFYYDQLPYYGGQADDSETQVTRKVIFTPKLGRSSEDLQEEKRYDVDFTPRLGRRQSEPVTASDEQVYRADGNQVESGRSKYFSPRLGRTVKLTPRLGRAFNYEMYPSKIRLARSTNSTKST